MLKWDFNHEKRALMGFKKIPQLVGGDWNHGILNDVPYIGNFIIPTDELIFIRRGRYTTNQNMMDILSYIGKIVPLMENNGKSWMIFHTYDFVFYGPYGQIMENMG